MSRFDNISPIKEIGAFDTWVKFKATIGKNAAFWSRLEEKEMNHG